MARALNRPITGPVKRPVSGFIRARVHSIEPADNQDLKITCFLDSGELREETFNLVVLSIGLEISKETRLLAGKLGVDLDSDGFAATGGFSPVATSRPGIFASGAFAGPKDIPQSVMEASAAASASAALLARARNSLTLEKSYPEAMSVLGQIPRIGVFVCHCGTNIAGVVDVPSVRDYAETLPDVVFAANNLFTCSQDTQQTIRQAIQDHGLNRVVVAACTPRTHEPLFQETIQEAIDIAPIVSVVDEALCIGCGLCEASCSFGAIRLKKVIGKGYRAENFSALCKGCGVCAAACPQQAIDMKHFREKQILAALCAGAAA